MAGDLQNKSKQTDGAKTTSIAQQKPIEVSAESDSSPIPPEQRQILGNVYQLILGWRRERLMKAAPQIALTSPGLLPAEREA